MAYIGTKRKRIRRKKSKWTITWKLIVSSVITVLAIWLYLQTFSNYYVLPHQASGIVGGQYPDKDKLQVNQFTLNLDTTKNLINLTFQLNYQNNGNYTAFLTLPYQIASYQNLTSANWYIKNAASGSVVMAVLDVSNYTGTSSDYTDLSAQLSCKDSLLDKTFETNTLILPFGGSYAVDMQQKIDQLQSISPITSSDNPFNGVVSITVPYSAVGVVASLPIDHTTPTNNPQVQMMSFNINEFKTFQFQYVDSQARYQFELSILLIGVLLGITFPILIDFLTKGLAKASESLQKHLQRS